MEQVIFCQIKNPKGARSSLGVTTSTRQIPLVGPGHHVNGVGPWCHIMNMGPTGGMPTPPPRGGILARQFMTIYDLVSLFSDVVSIFVTILRAKAPSLIKHDEATNFVIE